MWFQYLQLIGFCLHLEVYLFSGSDSLIGGFTLSKHYLAFLISISLMWFCNEYLMSTIHTYHVILVRHVDLALGPVGAMSGTTVM